MKPEFQATLDKALAVATDTRHLLIGRNNSTEAAELFKSLFPGKRAIIIGDDNTCAACGDKIHQVFVQAGIPCETPFIFNDPNLHAEHSYVEQLETAVKATDAIPVAVGSGTLNDITKLVAHRCGRKYICIATAASMDGYTAYGASITFKGSKQTFDCPAPLAVVADLDIIAKAPSGMNASGYADLLAKLPAGADWILADALGIESIDPAVWEMVQKHLPEWLSDPAGVANGDPAALESLVAGLMMGGFAMQHHKTSRPASGAEHQFSHLWDMQHHRHNGKPVSHGFKVGIGTLASAAAYEFLYDQDFTTLDSNQAAAMWPTWNDLKIEIINLYDEQEIRDKALMEAEAKYIAHKEVQDQLETLKQIWPELKSRLQKHLPSRESLSQNLSLAGAPNHPEQIGISANRLRTSYSQALHIRRRYTVLDVLHRSAIFDSAMQSIFQSPNEGSP